MNRYPGIVVACAAALALFAGRAGAQEKVEKGDKKPPALVDPYTENKPELLKALGYVSFGPFPWADDHDTEAIERVLGAGKVLFVETAHFKIGVGLPTCPLPSDKDQRQRVQDELKRLGQKLPKVKPTAKELDPWLRLHLTAQRCEAIYTEVQKTLGVTDADFPTTPPPAPTDDKPATEPYMGEGPFLGQRGKFTVLLAEKTSSVGRYLNRFCRVEDGGGSMRFYFQKAGSMFYGGSAEGVSGEKLGDAEVHAELAFNVVHALIDGYKHYFHQLPIWLQEGLAKWFQRRANPKWNTLMGSDEGIADARREEDWAPRVRARVKHEAMRPLAELSSWFDYKEVKLSEHMQMWSLADYLMSQGDGGIAKYISMMKDRIAGTTAVPTHDQLRNRQKEAIARSFGTDEKGLDEAWRKWVLAKYPQK